MNDRLLFRVFNTETKKYMPAQWVDEMSVFILARLGNNKYIIEQCTGLKDKNGKLIYEGDILRLPWQAGWPPLVGVVKFNKTYACFLVSSNPIKEAERSFWWNNSKEVIGNIHENPELLENTNAKH